VGRHHRVSALLAGIHNKRFPQPKYLFIWDVEKVISYLTKLGISDLSDRLLTLKLTMLLELTSAARAHEICFLDVRYLVKHSTGYTFHFGKPTKTASRGKIEAEICNTPPSTALCMRCELSFIYVLGGGFNRGRGGPST